MGFATVTWPVSACYTMAKALRETYAALLRDGHTNDVRDRMVDFEEFNSLIGLPQVREAEAAYDEYAREMVETGGTTEARLAYGRALQPTSIRALNPVRDRAMLGAACFQENSHGQRSTTQQP